MDAEIAFMDENLNRTNSWENNLTSTNKTSEDIPCFSPVGDLTSLLFNQSLHDTPKRRLDLLFNCTSNSLSPDDIQDEAKNSSDSKSIVPNEFQNVCKSENSNSMENSNFTKIRSISTSSFFGNEKCLSPRVLVSPAPSSVFLDDDLQDQDSGYPIGRGSDNKELFLKPVDFSNRSGKNLTREYICEMDDGFIDELIEIDENASLNGREFDPNSERSQNTPKKRKSCLGKQFMIKNRTDEESLESDIKRHKSLSEYSSFTSLQVKNENSFQRCHSEAEIIHAVQIADENRTLIGDFSDVHVLPLLDRAEISDLRCIDASTVRDLLEKKFENKFSNFILVDCRYWYEYAGGHIRGAINVFTKDKMIETFFRQFPQSENHSERNVLIFYCEFSKERGPKMSRFLRAEDRKINHLQYPKLFYPEIYLLEGGYKNFYENFQGFCDPQAYKPMVHEDHAEDLRKLRVKSKSWSNFVQDGSSKMKLIRRPGLNRGLFS